MVRIAFRLVKEVLDASHSLAVLCTALWVFLSGQERHQNIIQVCHSPVGIPVGSAPRAATMSASDLRLAHVCAPDAGG